jgi:hypothetical protein
MRSMLIGILITDGWSEKRGGWNTRLSLKQSMKNFEYLWEVFKEVSVLCCGYPILTKTIKRGKLFFGIQFQTRQLVCLNELRD